MVLPGADGVRLAASPNPFTPQTAISFRLTETRHVRLAVYDLRGRLVRRLVDETRSAGDHEVRRDGRDEEGRAVAAGVYPVRLQAGEVRSAAKLLVVR